MPKTELEIILESIEPGRYDLAEAAIREYQTTEEYFRGGEPFDGFHTGRADCCEDCAKGRTRAARRNEIMEEQNGK